MAVVINKVGGKGEVTAARKESTCSLRSGRKWPYKTYRSEQFGLSPQSNRVSHQRVARRDPCFKMTITLASLDRIKERLGLLQRCW